jgi:hypothetical protein
MRKGDHGTSMKVACRVWRYPGKAGWYFASIPERESAEIRSRFKGKARGWGSVPVMATVGTTTWRTSLFPDSRSGVYLLPLKLSVREREAISDGNDVLLQLSFDALCVM